MSPSTSGNLSLDDLKRLVHQPSLAQEKLFALLAALACDEEEVRAWANDCLELIERPARDSLPELGRLTADSRAPVAGWACKLLGRSGDTACEPDLIRTLQEHSSVDVTQQAALALSRLPILSEQAHAALAVAAQSDDPRLRRISRRSMEKRS